MRAWIKRASLATIGFLLVAAAPVPDGDPLLGQQIDEIEALSGRVWLRGGLGGLVTLEPVGGERRVAAPAGVVDMLRQGAELQVLRMRSPGRYGVETYRSDGEVRALAEFEVPTGDRPLALVMAGPDLVVLGQERAWRLVPGAPAWTTFPVIMLDSQEDAGRLRARDLRELLAQIPVLVLPGQPAAPPPPPVVRPASPPSSSSGIKAAVTADGRTAYLGFNYGEWGGGLRRIDLASGKMEAGGPAEGLCSGKLNLLCGPITGLITDPSRPDCVLASMGLSHFSQRGRILRACAKETTLLYEDKIGSNESPAVFGLAPAKEGFLAITYNEVWRFLPGEASPKRTRLGDLQTIEGTGLQRLGGAVVVTSMTNARMSLSGAAPLVAGWD